MGDALWNIISRAVNDAAPWHTGCQRPVPLCKWLPTHCPIKKLLGCLEVPWVEDLIKFIRPWFRSSAGGVRHLRIRWSWRLRSGFLLVFAVALTSPKRTSWFLRSFGSAVHPGVIIAIAILWCIKVMTKVTARKRSGLFNPAVTGKVKALCITPVAQHAF